MIYDSGSVPQRVILSPRETSPDHAMILSKEGVQTADAVVSAEASTSAEEAVVLPAYARRVHAARTDARIPCGVIV